MDIIERLEDVELWIDAQDDAIAEIKRLRALTAWRPIAEAPKDGTWVILGKRNASVAGFFDRELNHWVYGDHLGFINPTHWQPLPEPPGQE